MEREWKGAPFQREKAKEEYEVNLAVREQSWQVVYGNRAIILEREGKAT